MIAKFYFLPQKIPGLFEILIWNIETNIIGLMYSYINIEKKEIRTSESFKYYK
jgi:hypothetical protein